MTKRWKWGILGLVLMAAAVGVWIRTASSGSTIHPWRGSIVEAVYGLGTVTPEKVFQLKIGVTSTIRELYVKEGQEVTRGGSLLLLDNGGLFRAPFSGVVTSVPFNQGENVFPQVPILTLMDLSERYLVVSLEQQAALRVKTGQVANLSFESLRNQKFLGKVRSIFPKDGQFMVRIDLENLPAAVLPGMTADVAIEIARRESALLVPQLAIQGGKLTLMHGGRKRKVDVKVGAVDGENAEIVSEGISPNDEVWVGRAAR